MTGIPVLPECALIDPYFERGSFLVRAPLGHRSRTRTMIRDFARTHADRLRISVTTYWDDPAYFYVIVL